jgi:hypothetical protein
MTGDSTIFPGSQVFAVHRSQLGFIEELNRREGVLESVFQSGWAGRHATHHRWQLTWLRRIVVFSSNDQQIHQTSVRSNCDWEASFESYFEKISRDSGLIHLGMSICLSYV